MSQQKIMDFEIVRQEYQDRECPRCRQSRSHRRNTEIGWDYHIVTWKCDRCNHTWMVGAKHYPPINPRDVITFKDEVLTHNLGRGIQ